MNILFLDIDGVLVHHSYNPTPGTGLLDHMDPKCVKIINDLCKDLGLVVVVHSTWVHVDPPEHIMARLKEAGFELHHLHHDWVCNSTRDKSAAIASWILKHPEATAYLVIDDEKIGTHPQVQVFSGMFTKGIQLHHREKVVQYFS